VDPVLKRGQVDEVTMVNELVDLPRAGIRPVRSRLIKIVS